MLSKLVKNFIPCHTSLVNIGIRNNFTAARRISSEYSDKSQSVWDFCRETMESNNATNYGQGYPTIETPQFVKDAAIKAISDNNNQYTSPQGHPLLVDIICNTNSNRFNRELNNNNVQITIGACAGIQNTLQAIINSGDEVITFEPYFDFFRTQVNQADGILKTAPINCETNIFGELVWKPDFNKLRNVITDKTKCFILNTPHNPTGYVFNEEDMDELMSIMELYPNIIIIIDEVYSDIIFDKYKHITLASYKNMFNRCITVNSASKKFGVTGWKIGWTIGPDHLIKAINYITKAQNWCQPTPLQVAVAQCLELAEKPYNGYSNYYEWLRNLYQSKRDNVINIIENGGLQPIKSLGSFFVNGDISNLVKSLKDNKNDLPLDWQISKIMAEKTQIMPLPVSAFTSIEYPDRERFLRFSTCVDDKLIQQSCETIKKLKNELGI